MVFCINFAICQSSFEYLYSSPYDEISRSLTEDDQGNVYFTVENNQYGSIIKLDPSGIQIDSINIFNGNGTSNLSEIIRIDSEYFIVLGSWSDDSLSELWFTKFNNELNIELDVKLPSNGMALFGFHHIINHKGNIVFMAHYNPINSSGELKICLYEVTLDGTIIANQFLDQVAVFNIASTLLENCNEVGYKVFSLFPVTNRGLCTINYIDQNLVPLDSSAIFNPNQIRDQNTARWLDDSTYLITGKVYMTNQNDFDIGILKVLYNDSIIDSRYFGKPDTVDYAGLYKNLDFISHDNIFFAGESNILTLYQNDPSWIMLNILDSNLNLKCQHFYGGDAFYLVNAILATQDSGCVLSCSRYDYLTQDNEFDIYILKVNKDGLLVGTPEQQPPKPDKLQIFPNPARENITVRYPDIFNYQEREVVIYNALGNEVKRLFRPPGQPEEEVNISDLPAGLYIAVYKIAGEKIAVGKFLVY